MVNLTILYITLLIFSINVIYNGILFEQLDKAVVIAVSAILLTNITVYFIDIQNREYVSEIHSGRIINKEITNDMHYIHTTDNGVINLDNKKAFNDICKNKNDFYRIYTKGMPTASFHNKLVHKYKLKQYKCHTDFNIPEYPNIFNNTGVNIDRFVGREKYSILTHKLNELNSDLNNSKNINLNNINIIIVDFKQQSSNVMVELSKIWDIQPNDFIIGIGTDKKDIITWSICITQNTSNANNIKSINKYMENKSIVYDIDKILSYIQTTLDKYYVRTKYDIEIPENDISRECLLLCVVYALTSFYITNVFKNKK